MAGDQAAHDAFIQQFMQTPLATMAEAEAAWLANQAGAPDTSGTVAWSFQRELSDSQKPKPFQMVKNTPPVWAGGAPGESVVVKPSTPDWAKGKETTTTMTGDEAVGWLDDIQWNDPKQYAEVVGKMIAARLISADADPLTISNAWAKIVDHAVGFYKRDPETRMTPLGVLDLYAAGGGGAGGAGSPSTTTYITQSSAPDIQARYQAMGQQLIGQTPDAGEAPVGAVQAAEKANPSVVTQTPSGTAEGTQTTTGGLDQTAIDKILTDRAKQNPNYGAYQAATTYYNALLQLLGPATSTGSNR